MKMLLFKGPWTVCDYSLFHSTNHQHFAAFLGVQVSIKAQWEDMRHGAFLDEEAPAARETAEHWINAYWGKNRNHSIRFG